MADDINPALPYIRTLNHGNYGIFLTTGNASTAFSLGAALCLHSVHLQVRGGHMEAGEAMGVCLGPGASNEVSGLGFRILGFRVLRL